MNVRALLRLMLLGVAFAIATVFVNWWAVPIIGALWGLVAARGSQPVLTAGVSAGLGWGGLLAIMAFRGPVGAVATKVGGVMGISGWMLVAGTLAFAALLAASAAGVVAKGGAGRKR